jgi:hypothetical protein
LFCKQAHALISDHLRYKYFIIDQKKLMITYLAVQKDRRISANHWHLIKKANVKNANEDKNLLKSPENLIKKGAKQIFKN